MPSIKFSIKIPRWKDNPNFNAQAAHFAVGSTAGLIACAGHHTPSHPSKQYWFIVAGFNIYSVLKEFWYDAEYEIPQQSFGNNLEDWIFYTTGFVTGVLAGTLLNR